MKELKSEWGKPAKLAERLAFRSKECQNTEAKFYIAFDEKHFCCVFHEIEWEKSNEMDQHKR